MGHFPSHRIPLILAIILHAILFFALFIHFASPNMRNIALQPDVDIIKAVAVNPADVAAQTTQIKAEEEQKQREAQEAALALEQQKQAAQQQKEAQKQAQEKAEAAALLEQQQAEQKALTQKQQTEKAVETKKALETKKIAEEKTNQAAIKKQQQEKDAQKKQAQKAAQALKLAQQEALQNQIAAEQKQLEAAKTDQQQSEIDKFTALILHTMRQNWMVPEGVNPNISCQLSIHLNTDGTVISVTLLRSSGNAALDNSARLAIFKSSPLPVPADADLFKVFRQFNVTVSPKDIQ